jgi:hypothetical protein
MNPTQLAARTLFVKRLVDAGWNPGGWEELFEAGSSVLPEAQAEYRNQAAQLRLSYYVGEGYVKLECVPREGHPVLIVHCYPRQNAAVVADSVIAQQQGIDAGAYGNTIDALMPVCERLVLDTSDGLITVKPDA